MSETQEKSIPPKLAIPSVVISAAGIIIYIIAIALVNKNGDIPTQIQPIQPNMKELSGKSNLLATTIILTIFLAASCAMTLVAMRKRNATIWAWLLTWATNIIAFIILLQWIYALGVKKRALGQDPSNEQATVIAGLVISLVGQGFVFFPLQNYWG